MRAHFNLESTADAAAMESARTTATTVDDSCSDQHRRGVFSCSGCIHERQSRSDEEKGRLALTDAQRAHLRTVLGRLMLESRTMAAWVADQGFAPGVAEALARDLAAIRERVQELAGRLGVPLDRDRIDPARKLRGWAAVWWSTVLDCRPQALTGYGRVDPELARFLEPRVSELAAVLMRIRSLAERD